MRHLYIIAALFILAGCEHMEFVAVDYHSGYNYGPYVRPVGHVTYTLGYYSGNYYNGWAVRGSHGHRYYYAPQHYAYHRHFTRPVVVQHVHVHASYCEHNYRPRNPRNDHRDRDNNRNSYVQPQVRNDTRSTPSRVTPARQRNDVTPTRNQTRNDSRRRDATPPRTQPTRVAPARRTPTRVAPQRETAPRANNNRVERADRVERGRRNKDQKQNRK